MIGTRDVEAARVLLVEAPIGYGKSSFADRVLSERDGTVVRIRPYGGAGTDGLAAAVARALRRSGLAAAAETVASAEPADALDDFVATLAARPGPGAQVLVEDAHLLDPEAAGALLDALADLPTACRVIVCGRDLTAFRPLASRPDATAVGADDLRLDAGDIAALLDGVLVPAAATAAELLAATEGWPAAVDLAVARLRREPTWSASGSSGARGLMRGLVEGLAAADPRVATVVWLPLHDDATLALLDPGDTRPIDVPTRPVGRWRVVPAAVRELFDERPALPPDTVHAIAGHYHRNGETTAAIALVRDADPVGLTGFLAGLSWVELADLELSELRVAVDLLDGQPDAARVRLNAARAVELSDRALRAVWLERAGTDAAPGPTARAVAAEVARDVLRSGEVDRGAELSERVLAEAAPDEYSTRARALVTVGMRHAFLCTPDTLAEAARTFAEAADLYGRAGETRLQAETLARLGYTALYIAGYPAEGVRSMSEALALLPVGDRVRAFWLTMYADAVGLLGRADESEAAVREALEIGERRRDPTTLGMAWWTRSWFAALRGDAAGMRAALVEVERHRGAWLTGGQEAEYLGSTAEHLSLVGDVAGYLDYIEQARRSAEETGYAEVVATPHAYFEAEHGDPVDGLRLLDELETIPGVAQIMAPRRLLLRAVALLRSGDAEAARAVLQEAIDLSRAMGVPDLLPRMHRHQYGLVAGLLDEPAPPSAEPRLQVLGGFALTAGEADRTPQPGHPATLVKLLALRGTLTAEAAIEALWPDADVGTGRSRLRNLLNRLKERSGPVVVRTGDLLRLDDAIRIDATAFDRAAAAALSAPGDERVGRARHAIALYTGELLPGDVYEEWSALDRARLQRQFVSLADLVAADGIDRGDLDEAARLLDLGISAEPLDESRPLLLCALLVEQGRASAAQQVARRCADALRELGVEPSPALARHAQRPD